MATWGVLVHGLFTNTLYDTWHIVRHLRQVSYNVPHPH